MDKFAAMIILTIRTDKPEAELGLFDDYKKLDYMTWEAHRKLTITLNRKIDELLNKSDKNIYDIQGIVCFKGPGSFTGLRVGMSVANALGYSQTIPVVTAKTADWQNAGIRKLLAGGNEKITLPFYSSPPATTKSKK